MHYSRLIMSDVNISIDISKLEKLSEKVMGDAAGAMGVMMAYIGDQTGIYKKMESLGPATTANISESCGLLQRYVEEFLAANVALGYVDYQADSEMYSLSPEQAKVFAHEGQLECMQGIIQGIVGQYATYETAIDVFKSGRGRPWDEHSYCLFCSTDRFFRPVYEANLLTTWIPGMQGVVEKLSLGGKIADIACGQGSSSIIMAKRFPKAIVHGFDFHGPSIEKAREKAISAGLTNVEFFEATAKTLPNNRYDFACIFDALHDLGDPVGAAQHIYSVLSEDGTFMVVEPLAGDSLTDNLNPLGTLFYSFSTLVCVPNSLSQEVGLGLGAQAGEKRLTKVLQEASFTKVRRIQEADTNIVLEVKK